MNNRADDSALSPSPHAGGPRKHGPPDAALAPSRRARIVLGSFLITFLIARVLVLLIMSHRLPAGLFLHVGGTHVHHLNYGIFLLSGVAGWALFFNLRAKQLHIALLLYGMGLALTFDEFGMWLHLGGLYWQRASYDAILVIAAGLGLLASAPAINRLKTQHIIVSAIILAVFLAFAALLIERINRYGTQMGPWLTELERTAPP